MDLGYEPYQPQFAPIVWVEDIWTVEGPLIAYRTAGLKIPCPTRMTVVKLAEGDLWLHSPIARTPELEMALARLGRVAAFIAPNSYHHRHLADWAAAYPDARIYTVPGLVHKFPSARLLPGQIPDDAIACSLFKIRQFEEALFFHRPSKTLIVTDLMQAFEPSRVHQGLMRFLLRAVGAAGPKAGPSMELWPFSPAQRRSMSKAVRQMLDWQPQSVILSHGKCITRDAPAEIAQAFAFLRLP